MITILERPQGHVLDTTAKTATVSESYGAGDAQFVVPTVHGLTDGDWIYSVSDIDDYAGFFYVDVTTTGIFKLKTSANGDYVQFIASGSITYYESNLTHGWSAVHLPITYKLSSNLYPVNSSDTSQTISSVTDSNGYSVIHISGSLGSGVNSYDFIKITVPSDTDYSGVYQILEFISPTVMIINLDYDSSINWTSASALKHYNNYNILVRVYAGLNASHEWAGIKPYELAATLELTPDADNECFFSINEILKSYIETRNNLGLGTLPNNIDFMTMFYIETAESYDDSDGYVFGTYTSNFTSDQGNFEGYAVNAKLEFKNIYSGYLSEYLMTNSAAKFLTLFTTLVLTGCYQDISFIIGETDEYNFLEGTSSPEDKGYQNSNLGYPNWILNAASVTISSGESYTEIMYKPNTLIEGVTYQFDSSVDGTGTYTGGGGNALSVILAFYDNSFAFLDGANILAATGSAASLVTSSSIKVPSGAAYIGVQITSAGLLSGSYTVDVNYVTLNRTQLVVRENGVNTLIDYSGEGLYRYPLTDMGSDFYTISLHGASDDTGSLSEVKQISTPNDCANQSICLTWLNNLGGLEYWAFTAQKDHIIEIQEAIETKKNILPQWPKSYGSTADTIRKQTARISNKSYTVRSQFLTADEADAIAYIKSSALVQIINSRQDRRTVIVDTDSFVKRKDGDKTFEIAFNISFTDDIPSQTV